MKVFADKVKDVKTSGISQGSSFAVDDGGKLVLTILRNTYSNPVGAIVRELSQNASEVDPNFRIHTPTTFEPWFSVIDNGTGLSHEDTVKYFSGLGASTKDKDDTKVGGFGIGCKVPFSVVDQYQVIVRYEGKIRTYIAYLDDYQKPQFTMAKESDTTEPNGIEVRVPTKTHEIEKYKGEIAKQLMFFNPRPDGYDDTLIPQSEVFESGTTKDGIEWTVVKTSTARFTGSQASLVVMGNLWYPVDPTEIDHIFVKNYSGYKIRITAPIGSVALQMSREAILYNEKTVAFIKGVCDEALDSIIRNIKNRIEQQLTPYAVAQEINSTTNFIRSVKNSLSIDPVNKDGFLFKGRLDFDMPDWVEDNGIESIRQIDGYDVRNLKVPKTFTRSFGQTLKDLLFYDEGKVYYAEKINKISKTAKHNQVYGYFIEANNVDKFLAVMKRIGIPSEVLINYNTLEEPPKDTKTSVVNELYKYTGRGFSSKHVWAETKIDDLDRATGIYVELYRWEIRGNKGYRDFKRLKELKLIPEDTILYGSPASRKNPLKDHPNFISLDDAYELGMSILEEVVQKQINRAITAEALERLRHNVYSRGVDNVENTLYNKLVLKKLTVENAESVRYVINNSEKYRERINYRTTEYINLVRKKYPMLEYMVHRVPETVVADYIKTMEKCK